jgi:hypothetical protein
MTIVHGMVVEEEAFILIYRPEQRKEAQFQVIKWGNEAGMDPGAVSQMIATIEEKCNEAGA